MPRPRFTLKPDLDILLAEIRKGTSIRRAEQLAGYSRGVVAQWARRKDGAQLSLYAARVDAALKERVRLTRGRNALLAKPEMGVAVKERKRPAQPAKADTSGCVHFFDIGNEHDGTSSGRCRKCGLRRVFRNEPSDAGASWGWRKGRQQSAEEQESALNAAREGWSFDGEPTTTGT